MMDSLALAFRKATTKISNLLIHIPIDARPHPAFTYTLQIISILQLVSIIADPSSQLHQATFWTEPNNYLPPQFTLSAGMFLLVTYIVLLSIRLSQTESDNTLVKPTMCLKYISTVLAYFQHICQTVLFVPLLTACLKQMQMATNAALLSIGVISYILYLAVVFPVALYCSSGTSVLTENKNRKISVLNLELLFNIYKIIFVLSAALNQTLMLAFGPIFFLIFWMVLLKRPYFCYEHQEIKRMMISAIAFVCLVRVINAMFNKPQGSAILQIVATGFFAFFVEWICLFRLKKILEQENFSVYQIKCLIFMVYNMSSYLELLEYFILRHHKKCQSPVCKCSKVIGQLADQETELNSEKIWYDFIVSYAHEHFDMKTMNSMPITELERKMSKFYRIVFDMAEIYLFKLDRRNIAFLMISEYRNILKSHQLNNLWDMRKYKTFMYYLHQEIDEHCKGNQTMNHNADKYLDFQIEFTGYVKLLIKSAKKFTDFWDEMGKKDPDEPTLLTALKKLGKWNIQIRKQYKRITKTFTNSTQLMDPISSEYCDLILNMNQKDQLHIVKKFQAELSQKKRLEKARRMDENTRIYSYDSQTAMCFVSVDPASLGKIEFTNMYFDELIYDECGVVRNISQLLMPEMRQEHSLKMQRFVRGDELNLEHNENVMMTSYNHIAMAKMMIQLIPSVSEGLRYAVFLKNLQVQRNVFCWTSRNDFHYISSSMEYLFDTRFTQYELKGKVFSSMADLKASENVRWQILEREFIIKMITEFKTEKESLLLFEVIEEQQEQLRDVIMATQIRKKTRKNTLNNLSSIHSDGKPMKSMKQSAPLANSNSFTIKKKSVFTSSIRNTKESFRQKEDSEFAQKTVDKRKKEDEDIKKNYSALLRTKGDRKIIKSIFCFMVAISVLFIVLMICLIAFKKSQLSYFEDARRSYQDFNSFMMLVINTATNLLRLNFHTSVPTANSTFLMESIKNTASFTQALDKLVSHYQISSITETWTTLQLQSDVIFNVSSRNNLMTIYDFIQSPMNNLAANYNISDYNFPISYDYLTAPLSNIERQFHNYISNALYITLPNMQQLKHNVMAPLITEKTNIELPVVLICIFVILTAILSACVMAACKMRIVKVRHQTHRFLEALPTELIHEKKVKGQQFFMKYCIAEEESKKEKEATAIVTPKEAESEVLFTNISRNFSKAFEDWTDRQLEDAITTAQAAQDEKQSKVEKENTSKPENVVEVSKRKKQTIFGPSPYVRFLLILASSIIPLIIFGVIMLVMMEKESINAKLIVDISDQLGFIERQLASIKLYSLQNGVYSVQLDSFNSIPTLLATRIYTMFHILQIIMIDFDGQFVPQLLNFFIDVEGNVCSAEQKRNPWPSDYQFPGRGNLSYCQSISNGILKSGFLPSVLHYLQNANRNFLSNPTPFTYSQSEKIAYLNNFFNTNTSLLVDYFILISQSCIYYAKNDLENMVKGHFMIALICGSIFITIVLIWITLLNDMFLIFYRQDINEITSAMTSISCRSVMENQELRKKFFDELQTFKTIK